MNKALSLAIRLCLFLFLFVGFFRELRAITQDLGRHIKTGEIILQTGSIPKINLFSYTNPDFPFINTHWLSEVVFAGLFYIGGLPAIFFFSLAIAFLSFGVLFVFSLRRYSLLAIGVAGALLFRVLAERTDIRPEIFSIFFFTLFLVILYKNREKQTRLIFLLPLLTVLWVNTHIYFLIGIVTVGLFLLDAIFTHRKTLLNQYVKTLLLVFVGCSFASLLNPYGIDGSLYPLRVFNNYGYAIEENQNIFFLWGLFQKQTILFYWVSVLLLFSSLFLSIKKARPIDWLLSIVFSLLAVSAVRHFPLFAIAVFIPFAASLTTTLLPFQEKKPLTASLFVLLFILWQIFLILPGKTLGFGVPTGGARGVDFFLSNNIQGPLFNNFDVGSYLIYRLYPQEKVFVDGRPEAYPATFFTDIYKPMQNDPLVFEAIDSKYHFNTIFFSHTDQTPWAQAFLLQITNNKAWTSIFIDPTVILLVKNNKQNESLIRSFGITKDKTTIANFHATTEEDFIYLALLFNKIAWNTLENQAYLRITSINPNSCFALYNVARLHQKDSTGIIYQQKYAHLCK